MLRNRIGSFGHVQRRLNSSLSAFEQLVGNTRLVKLKYPSELTGCTILGKCEYENPGGSIKDRAALSMIQDAESRGILKRGEKGIIVEGTAGNTGIGLALAAGVFGYKCVIVIAETQSEEKKQMLRAAGAHLVQVAAVPYRDPNNYVHVAKRLADALSDKAIPYRSFYADQWDNLANRSAHINGTGPEIMQQVKQFGGKLDVFSCAMGTGGTLSGAGTYLRQHGVKIGLTDPCGGAIYRYFTEGELRSEGSSISEGIGQGRITGNLGDFVPDLFEEVGDPMMLETLEGLQKHDGLALGGSAGVNVSGAIKIAKKLGPGHTLCTVLCDLGSRYAGKLYNPKFLKSKGLPVAPWIEEQPEQEAHDQEFFDILKEATAKAKQA